MEFWESGELMELLKEAETIQKCLKTTNTASTINEISKKFSREMRRGSVHNVINQTYNMKNGILPLTEKTLQELKQKHPPKCNADPEVLLPEKPKEVHPIKFASIDAESVRKTRLKTRGGAGGLTLKVRRGCLHQLNLEITQLIYATLLLRQLKKFALQKICHHL